MSDINSLFTQAHAEGELSTQSLQTLTNVDADIGGQIQAGLGISPDDVPGAEVILVTIMPDDSGSIFSDHNEEHVRQGHNLVLDALRTSRQNGDVLAHTRYLNGRVLFPYCQLTNAKKMDSANFGVGGGTPLYDQTAVILGTVLAKTREFAGFGVPARSVTLIITDGADMHSTHQTPLTLRPLVEDLLRSEAHIVAAMGISDGSTDFRKIFLEMGIRDQWILTPGNSADEIRKAFRVFSQSVARASQGAATFATATLGGFGVN